MAFRTIGSMVFWFYLSGATKRIALLVFKTNNYYRYYLIFCHSLSLFWLRIKTVLGS